jgi:hypothetical protein
VPEPHSAWLIASSIWIGRRASRRGGRRRARSSAFAT